MMRLLKTSLLLLSLAVMAVPSTEARAEPSTAAAASQQDLGALLSAIQARYANTKAVSAKFTQVTRSGAMGAGPAQEGTILIARPRQMRVEFTGANASQFISDGQTLWVYSPASKQVIVTPDLTEQSDGLSDLLGSLAALEERFVVSRLPAPQGKHLLSLAPRPGSGAEAQFKALRLEVDAQSLLLSRLEIVDAFDGVTEMRFSGVVLDPSVPVGAFGFTPPAGVQVVRTDQI